MNLINSLKKTALYFEQKNPSLFSYAIEKQESYLESLNSPNSDIDRSYNQYKCKMKLYGFPIGMIVNLASLVLASFFYLRKKKIPTQKNKKRLWDAVSILDGKPENILPEEVHKDFLKIFFYNRGPHFMGLDKEDKFFIKNIWKKHPFSWHFLLKIMIKTAMYSYIIEVYKPRAIIVCAEYSFTSSALTAYCDKRGVKHINVMHGEKLFYMRDSFFRFHQCYIWDNYYKNLFIKLKAEPNQFTVSVPESLSFYRKNDFLKTVDFTYYLGNENIEILNRISKILTKLSNRGFIVSVRPHPRYSNLEKTRELFNEIEIEDVELLTIENSLRRTKNAVSLYSTVLNQAFHNDVGVVIDDLSNPVLYSKLFGLQYINLLRNHELLSNIIN